MRLIFLLLIIIGIIAAVGIFVIGTQTTNIFDFLETTTSQHPCFILVSDTIEVYENALKSQKITTAKLMLNNEDQQVYFDAMEKLSKLDTQMNQIVERAQGLNCHENQDEWLTDEIYEKMIDSGMTDQLLK